MSSTSQDVQQATASAAAAKPKKAVNFSESTIYDKTQKDALTRFKAREQLTESDIDEVVEKICDSVLQSASQTTAFSGSFNPALFKEGFRPIVREYVADPDNQKRLGGCMYRLLFESIAKLKLPLPIVTGEARQEAATKPKPAPLKFSAAHTASGSAAAPALAGTVGITTLSEAARARVEHRIAKAAEKTKAIAIQQSAVPLKFSAATTGGSAGLPATLTTCTGISPAGQARMAKRAAEEAAKAKTAATKPTQK